MVTRVGWLNFLNKKSSEQKGRKERVCIIAMRTTNLVEQ